MEFKEAIEILEVYIECAKDEWSMTYSKTDAKEFRDIIALLKRGEAYEKLRGRKMEIKEVKDCVEFLKNVWSVPIIGKDKLNKEWLHRIIKLIQRGEAYKQIVERLEKEYGYFRLLDFKGLSVQDAKFIHETGSLEFIIGTLREKYLKEIKP